MQEITMTREDLIKKARDKVMSTRKIICTGNPSEEKHIAFGIKKVWPSEIPVMKKLRIRT